MSSSLVVLGSLGGLACAVVGAAILRNRTYATFVGVLLTIHTLLSIATAPAFERVWPAWAYLQSAVYLHFLLLARPRMRSLPYRIFLSVPASFFAAGTLLSLPWAILRALGFHPAVPWLPYAI